MKVSIKSSDLEGEIYTPSSKSYTHRAITIAALSNNSVIHRPLISEDTRSTIRACEMFGAKIKQHNPDLIIRGVNGHPQIPDNVIDIANSGTTLRFMTAIAALTDGITVLTGDESIRSRPNGPLIEVLNSMESRVYSTRNNGCAPLVIHGGVKGSDIQIDGSISSQFISALLITCPILKEETTINIRGDLKSKPYVDITLELIEKAGGCIDNKEYRKFKITPDQKYDLKDYTVPGDFSSASYLLAAAVLAGKSTGITVKNIYPSRQGDRKIINILEQMEANIKWNRETGDATVKPGKLKGVTVDVGNTPDLVPTIAVLGAVAQGTTIIENAEHVRYKETDRLHAITVELRKMGTDIHEEHDRLIINGGRLEGADVHGWHDHRIVMALTVAGMVAGNTTVDTAESVAISYPDFFEAIRSLGARIQIYEE